MKIKSQRDFWAGLMFAVVGIGFAWGALSYPFGGSANPGPGYFPFGLGLLLALLGGLVLFKALSFETDGGDPIGPFAWRPLGLVLGAVTLFAFLLPVAGLMVALPVLVIVSSIAGGGLRWGEVLVNAAVLTFGCWLIFHKGLGLSMPLWPVGWTGFGG